MISNRFSQDQERVEKVFEKAVYLDECLQLVSEHFGQLEECLKSLSKGGAAPGKAHQELASVLQQVRGKANAFDPRELFKAIDILSHEFTWGSVSKLLAESNQLRIDKSLSEFSQKYTDYIKSYSHDSAIEFVNCSTILREKLRWYLAGLTVFRQESQEQEIDLSKYAEISILFTSTMSLHEFASKLRALERLYRELCMLLDISLTEYPLQIIKIESGSLWAKVFGHPVVIPFIKDVLYKGFGFAYRNFTKEGKLSAIPQKVENVEAILELSNKLEASGVDVKEINDHLRKSTVSIAKDMNVLISGEAEVCIDNEVISVGQEVQKSLVESKEVLQLNHDLDSNTNNGLLSHDKDSE